MPHKLVLKYLLDIESVITEIEQLQDLSDNQFAQFNTNPLGVRAAERLLEIVGEAINNISKIDNTISISHSREIIGLRNKIVHAYDTVDPVLLWGIIVNDIPVLKNEIEALKRKY